MILNNRVADWIIPERLIIGSSEYNLRGLVDSGVGSIICVAPLEEISHAKPHRWMDVYPLYLCDKKSADNMRSALQRCLELIREGDVAFLHCVNGYNRSAAVAVLVVQNWFCATRKEAIEYVSARRDVDPSKYLAMYDEFYD